MPISTQASLPLVTVIVPTYNCARFLPEALNSILAQQYPNLEIIVVDDGSSDGSADIAETYGSPVRVIRQENQGPAAARNRAAKEAKGEYFAFLDGDDIWLPEKLKVQVEHLLAHPEIGVVYGGFQRWIMDKNGIYPQAKDVPVIKPNEELDKSLSGWIYHHMLLDNYIHIITAVIPRKLFENLGGMDETLRVGEDYDFWLRATQIVQVHKLAKDVALYRVNPESTTYVVRPVNIEHAVLLRAVEKFGLTSLNGPALSENLMRTRLFKLAFGHGYLHFWRGSPCVALDSFKDAIKHDARHVKAIVYYCLSYLRCKLSRTSGAD